nr:synaptobrevin, longin-like domain protein [Tanacetum cinerariifolium]
MDNIGYVTEGKLTFFKNKFSPQWRFLVHTLLHCLSTKSGSWDQFGSPLVVALIFLSNGRCFNWSSYIFKGMVSNIGNPKKFLMYLRFLQTILGIETRVTRQHKVLVFSSKLFTNMRLNFARHPMPLLPAMLLQAKAGEVLEHGQSSIPYTASFSRSHETDAGPFTTVEDAPMRGDFHTFPPRSSQAPPTESELKDHKKLFKDVVGKLVKKVKALEIKLKTKKRKMVVSDSDQEDGGTQDMDLDALRALENAAMTVDFNIPSGGTSHIPAASPNVSTAVPPGTSDVPPGASTVPLIEEDILGEEAAKRLHDKKMAQMERQRAETLLGDDVSEDNFPARMAALIKRKRQALATQLAKERQNRSMTQAQQKAYMRQYVKNQSSAIYNTGWTMAYVKSFTDDQLKQEFEKIHKSTETPIPSVPEVPHSPAVSSPPSSHTRRKSLGRKRIHKPKSTLPKLDLDADAQTFVKVVVNEDSDYEVWSAVFGWEVLPTLLGEINALYRIDGGKGFCVCKHQNLWEIRSWRLYTLSNVHVLETVSGEVLSMFTDVSYPLSVKLMERMLMHKLEIDSDVVGIDMTTAEQLIQFIKNQLDAAQASSV